MRAASETHVSPAALIAKGAMATSRRVEINPKTMMGKPVIRGTWIPVELILRKLGEGATESDLLDAYPNLTLEDIRAAMLFAADAIAHQETADAE
jgi:uncharacterized protein (DUF433 family)